MTSVQRLAAGCYTQLGLTSIHHLYGAVRFDTPWRGHVAHVAVLVGLALAVCLAVRRLAPALCIPSTWLLLVLASLLPIGWIGVYEGGYNHLIKDVVFWLVGSDGLWVRMFPPPTYEPPVDFWFEVTGILQFLVSLWALHAARRVFLELKASRD